MAVTDAPIIPSAVVRFPILVAWDPDTGVWHATYLLTGAAASGPSEWDCYAKVRRKVERQFAKEGVSRKNWAGTLDEGPSDAFRDWVAAHFWGGSDRVHARVLELSMP